MIDEFYRFFTQNDVLPNSVFRYQKDFLVNHADASGNGFTGIIEFDFTSLQVDLAFVCWLHTVQDLHQGGFSRSIFTHNGMDLSFSEVQAYIIQRHEVGRKNFVDAFHFDDIIHRHLPFPVSGCRIIPASH